MEFSGPAIFPSNIDVPSSFVEHTNSLNTDEKQRKKRANPNDALVLSTAPEDPPTHWQQVRHLLITHVNFLCSECRQLFRDIAFVIQVFTLFWII